MEEYEQFINDKDKEKLVRCKGTATTTIKDKVTIDSIIETLKYSRVTKHDNYCIRSKSIK